MPSRRCTSLRKIIKTRGSFPNDDAALKLLYLAIKNASLRWRRMDGGHGPVCHSVRRAATAASGVTLLVPEMRGQLRPERATNREGAGSRMVYNIRLGRYFGF